MNEIYDIGMLREYLYDLRYHVVTIAVIFVLSTIAGYVYTSMNPDSAALALGELEGLIDILKDLSPLEIMLFIFLNNTIKSLFAILLGVGFGLVPIIFIAYNGYVLGVISYVTSSSEGLGFVLAAIIPHGIIELPMVILSVAIGLRLGQQAMYAIMGRDVRIKDELVKGIYVFMYWIVPMLFVAAMVETFITPLVASLI
ncbi:MAG: stage II sporulation protein M [Euryarchaeota archaeon]|nr:stage II sporulation protein M [Euryarchaeota archaeon]